MEEINWEAPEFEYQHKNILWYWTTIVLAVLFLALAIWQKNFLFAVFIVISEILVLIWGSAEPRILEFKINSEGIFIGENKFYSWNKISNFSFNQSILEGFNVLKINFKTGLLGGIFILLPIELTDLVRDFLNSQKIEEVEYEEHFFDTLQKFLGF
jgi:hypothetical protein